jgi:hypothetical protein
MEECSCERIDFSIKTLYVLCLGKISRTKAWNWDLPLGVVLEGEREEAGEPNMALRDGGMIWQGQTLVLRFMSWVTNLFTQD